MAGIRVSAQWDPTARQQTLLLTKNKVNNPNVKREINKRILARVDKYVPKDSGNLRSTGRAVPTGLTWTADYARYQYYGEIMGPNFPFIRKGQFTGNWWSPEHKKKTGRTIGSFVGTIDYYKWGPGHKFVKVVPVDIKGYTTSGTRHHWIRAMWNKEARALQNEITALLKRI